MFNYLILLVGLLAATSHSSPDWVAGSQRAGGPTMAEEITFKGAGGFELAGTFESPEGSGPFPAIVLLPGSGPTDRDGNSNILPIKIDTLKQIADRLAQDGIASLRFDKRAIARYRAAWPKTMPEVNKFFGWRNFVEDAEAALTTLRARPTVDPHRVGMVGHSEGSLITLQIASELPDPPSAIVLIGCTGRPFAEVVHDQLVLQLGKTPGIDVKSYLDYADAAFAALAAGKSLPPNPPKGLEALFNPAALDLIGAYCRLDSLQLARRYSGPVLVVNGQDDTQVLANRDTPALVSALKLRPKGSLEVLIVPKASHNLKSTAGGDNDAFGGPVNLKALDTISKWLGAELAKR